jgi:hypothetical protein
MRRVSAVIAMYCALVRESYLTALAEGWHRIDLYGNFTTQPTEPERKLAAQQLEAWYEKQRLKKPPPTVASPTSEGVKKND